MNDEQIDHHVTQAWNYALAHNTVNGVAAINDFVNANFTHVFTRKFAELLVRECIHEIHAAPVGDLKGKGYYLDKVAEHIENHFGVSEYV